MIIYEGIDVMFRRPTLLSTASQVISMQGEKDESYKMKKCEKKIQDSSTAL